MCVCVRVCVCVCVCVCVYSFPPLSLHAAQCPELAVPSFCSLIFNGMDITTNQSSYTVNDTVQFQCATGYQPVNSATDMVLSDSNTVCQDGNVWSLLDSTVACRSKSHTAGCYYVHMYTLNVCCVVILWRSEIIAYRPSQFST